MNEITYNIFTIENRPNSFLMFRNVKTVPTHFLAANGSWIALPWGQEEMEQMLEYVLEEGELPEWDAGAMSVEESSDGQPE